MSQKDTSTIVTQVSMAQGPSVQATPTPVVGTMTVQAATVQTVATSQISIPATAVSGTHAAANPEHYEVVVRAPAAHGMLAYLIGPGAEVVLKDIDLSKTTMANEAGNLRITLANGAEVLLLDFIASAHSKLGVTMATEQGEVSANKILAALDHDATTSKLDDVQPAEGIQTVGHADNAHGGGFVVPTINGPHYGIDNPVLSSTIGTFGIGHTRDSISQGHHPIGQGPGAPVLPPHTDLFARNDSYSTFVNTPISFDSKANDSNPEGTPFSVTSFTQPGNGTLVLNADNTFTFDPAAGFHGTVTFQYTITDGEGDVRTATDTITVNTHGLNAVNDVYTTPENTPITFDSKANDSNPDGTPFSVTSFTQPGNGTLVLNADNTFTFTPNHNFAGTVTFQYTILDAEGETRTATDTITVQHVDQGLNAVNDSYHTPENTPITFDSKANDSNPDGTPFSVTSFTQPGNGTLTLNADNTFTFNPDHNFVGTVTFNYTITDAEGETRTATDTIVIDHVNQGLFAVNDAYTTAENTPITFDSKANDSNPDGTPFSVTGFNQPGHGNLVLNADNTFTFTPDHNFAGTVSFQYTITDAEGETRTATDTITITHVDQGLFAVNDSYHTPENTPITFDSKVNDSNPDGTPFSVTSFTQPGNGTLVLNADNTFTFTPNHNFAGTVTFNYTITDAEGETRTATDTIVVEHVNQGLNAVNDSYHTPENTPITFDSKANDSNPDGTAFSVTSFTQPGNGTLVLNANNTFTFTPNHNFAGTVSFNYTITDAEGETRTATDTIVVKHVDQGLFAVNDSYHTPENTPITFDSKVNDSNPDGTPFSVTGFTQPGHGTLVLNADNTFTFTPDHGFSGTVQFNYTITDAEGETRTATDTIVIDHVNQGLFAVNDAYTTNENTPITFDSKVNDSNPDGTPFSITSFTQPGNGTLVLNADNTFTFTPNHNFSGDVHFNYTITDAEGETRTATDTIHVNHVNQGLFAVNDAYTTNENTPITFDSKVNDSNPDGTPFHITTFTQPGNGTLVLNADNTFTFNPAHNFSGDVTFQYTIVDAEGETRTATDTIHVNHVNQGLFAVNDAYTTNENTPITFDSKVNDSNPDGTPFHITTFTQPGNGTLVLNADNTFTFNPAHNFSGDVTFQYTIVDAEGETRTATDTIHVNHVNQGLFANNDAYTTNYQTPITFDSKVNDSNPDGTPFHVSSFDQPGHGTLVLNADNTFTFNPAAGFSGDVAFTYTITDAEGETRSAVDTIHVNGAPSDNTPPPPPPPVCPLVIDLGGDGIQIIHADQSHQSFDLTGDGVADHTAWVGPNDGMLVHDVGSNGVVTDANLFGNASVDGFTELAQLEDTNHDGVVNANDAAFNDLKVWTDTNGDGKAEAGELHSLSDLGITSISVDVHGDGQNLGDAFITDSSTVTYADGHTTNASDVWYALNAPVDTASVIGQQSEIVAAPATDTVAAPVNAPAEAAPVAVSSGAEVLQTAGLDDHHHAS